MSTLQKKDESDPSIFGIVFFAVLFALVGVASGFLLLASIPLKSFGTVAELEEFAEKNPKTSLLNGYCFKGPVSVTPDLVEKRDLLLNGQAKTVELTDGEINAWIAAEFSKPRSTFSLKDRPGVLILPDLPNFFIDESVGFTFSVPVEIIIYGKTHYHSVIVQGNFTKGSPVNFQTDTLRVNDAIIPLFKRTRDKLLAKLLQPYFKTDEFIAFMKAWEKVDSVELESNRIRLNLD